MKYTNISPGRFLSRPNRFVAYVDMAEENGCHKVEKVHVKNTGRCRELLVENAEVFLTKSDNPMRTTRYDLVAVQKGNRLINMDSQAPNRAVEEWLWKKALFPDLQKVTPEYKYKNSRFDFLVETEQDRILIEVKGVTLEKENAVYFPDAPSERAVKHVRELGEALREGYRTYVLLVVQMQGVSFFTPARERHPAFADALLEAKKAGVTVLAYDCLVTPESMEIDKEVPIRLSGGEQHPEEMVSSLLRWYDGKKRILPWREDPSPYHVWVSEIMLQQTRVEAVRPYYERFIKTLPDIESLALATEEVLLKLWEGLGYYNRVRNLKKAAVQVLEEYRGEMPSEYEELKKLSGIGSYTAGAVSSIAYGKRIPAVDGNVLRVFTRLWADGSDVTRQSVKMRLEEELKEILPVCRPGDFNQALMELGAVVCIPNGAPRCTECPWEELCAAHRMCRETEFPVKTPKKARSKEEKTILILRDEEKVALKKRPEKGLLAGMYEFPSWEGHLTSQEVLEKLQEMGYRAVYWKELSPSKHIFTHKEWDMRGFVVRVDELAEPKGGGGSFIFAEAAEVRERYPIPSAYAAYTEYLNIKLGI